MVGGRRPPAIAAPGGGGYLGSRTTSNVVESIALFDRDPRMTELRAMGLPSVWLRVAETIGVDAFLATWFILDAEPSFQEQAPGEPIRIALRRFSSWLRFQRNRYIEALAAAGANPREIQERLQKELCEKVSIRHISRIGRRTTIDR